MLTLRRRVREVVLIGDDIEVRVVAIRGHVVDLTFTAPKSVKVDRKEVRLGISAKQLRALEAKERSR